MVSTMAAGSSFLRGVPSSSSIIVVLMMIAMPLTKPQSFTIDYQHDTFLKDGQPFRYISGSIHYSRVPSYYWKDRLMKFKYAGLNAIQTYVPWNFHEPFPGTFNFDGDHDLKKFLSTAQEVGLLVILRAGPYICAEWEMGGLPSWLLRYKPIVLRSSDPTYLSAVDSYYGVLLPLVVKPMLYEHGGPVISVQVENEYGSYYTCDATYMNHLESLFRKHLGPNVILFTTDGAGSNYLKCGAIPSLYTTVDFGPTDNPKQYFSAQRQYQPHGPLVNSEFYTGWLDHWGSPFQVTNGQTVADGLDKILQLNASVNMYMFEGGTNFAFWNGANGGGTSYSPQITSYDYNAPLNERGELTDKFHLIRNVIKNYLPVPSQPPLTENATVYNDGSLMFKEYALLFDNTQIFTKQVVDDHPMTFEDMQQNYGFMLYTTVDDIYPKTSPVTLAIEGLHDRATVFWNKQVVGIMTRGQYKNISFEVADSSKGTIDILVENMGRLNYGSDINDRKGILDGVYLNGNEIIHWKSSSVPLNNTDILQFVAVGGSVPPKVCVFYRASFTIDSSSPIRDTFIQTTGWVKGVVFVNGINIGRYWTPKGPQLTLYIPANALKSGTNEVILFEIDSAPVSSTSPYGKINFSTHSIFSSFESRNDHHFT
jgi:beta-galactosidase